MELVPVRCRVPELLYRMGKDQQWLADKSGKGRQKISDYCTMRSIMNIRTAALLAYYLKCEIDDIYVWEWQQK
ncbi:putative transcriptional regulator [Paenibacillus prosopidis]|uniref:Putative transcriptional regulator n=1 Tax=Paenibacillus prosopidis TaxID=630520 RepID=A0A368VQT2_9BACL|nr:putative transcriptional regulator [Paenibacillus prosopidis]